MHLNEPTNSENVVTKTDTFANKPGHSANGDINRSLSDVLKAVPSRGYVSDKIPTPVEFMSRLSDLIPEGPQLWVKRDDLLPLAGGGSKTRKLDYLVQDGISKGADVLVTCGAVQYNHCRLTASAAAREGMDFHLILEERVPGSYNPEACGNNYLFNLLGPSSTMLP